MRNELCSYIASRVMINFNNEIKLSNSEVMIEQNYRIIKITKLRKLQNYQNYQKLSITKICH